VDRIAIIRTEAERLADVLAAAAPDARCPTCPDWSAADLLWHLTEVHFFWAGVLSQDVRTEADLAAVEQAKPERPADMADLLALRDRATTALLQQLGRLDDAEPRWSWWAPDQTVGFTRRMQTYEATMHRVDAELTAGLLIGEIDGAVAAGAVDHAVDVMWGWRPQGAVYEALEVVEFVASDVDRRWLVEVGRWTGAGTEPGTEVDGPMARRASTGEPTATVSAPVGDLALWAWGRGGTVTTSGAAASIAALDAVLANGM
jgi:uncharacterized protein (TIGR03083 family)